MTAANRYFIWTVLGLILLAMIAGSGYLVWQRFDQGRDYAAQQVNSEITLLASLVRNNLQQGLYQQVNETLLEWSANNSDVVAVRLTANNGFVISDYHRQTGAEHSLTVESAIEYSYSSSAMLILSKDIGQVIQQRSEDMLESAVAIAFIAIVFFMLTRLYLQHRDESERLRQEVSHRQSAESALRQSEERFYLAMQSSSDGLWDWNLDDQTMYLSDKWKGMLGYSTEELPNNYETWSGQIHPHDRDHVLTVVKNYIDGYAGNCEAEYRLRHKDGSWLYILSRAYLQRDVDGRPVRLTGTNMDITGRKSVEAMMERDREQQYTLRKMLEVVVSGSAFENTLNTCLDYILSISWLEPDAKGGIYIAEGVSEGFAEDVIGAADSKQASFALRASHNLDHSISSQCQRITSDLCYCAHAIAARELQYSKSIDEQYALRYPDAEDHGVYSIPLIFNEDVLGLLVVYLPANFPRDAIKEDYLTSAAGILAAYIGRYNIQQALEESEQRFRVQFEHAPEAILVFDADLDRFVDANQNAVRMFGIPRDKLLQCNPGKLVPPVQPDGRNSKDLSRETIAQALAGQQPVYERMLRNHEGKEFLCELRLVQLPASGRKLVRASITDITERKAGEAELLLTQFAVDHNSDAMFWIDSNGRVIRTNQSACEQLGYTREEIIGMRIWNLDADFTQEYWEKSLRALRRKGSTRMESRHLRKDGSTFPIEVLGNYIQFGGKEYVFSTTRDISERKQADKDLRQLNEELEDRVEKRTRELLVAKDIAERANYAKSQFLSKMSHELRTPLNAILGFAQLIQLDGESGDAAIREENLNEIIAAGKHLLELINEVLDLASIEAGKLMVTLEPVALLPLLKQCVLLMKPLASERDISIVEPDEICEYTVIADSTRLRQVILNLLSNSIKYNRSRGMVTISCGYEHGMVVISIEDTGPGLTSQQQARLFKPFERITADNSQVEGTGIGLALSKQLMELMHGQIGLTSTPRQGSTFWIRLPTQVAAHAVVKPKPLDVTEPVDGTTRKATVWNVLYIEDNPANIKLMQTLLAQRKQINLMNASLPGLGLELARIKPPAFIILDINLPYMDGYAVMESLRSNPATRHIPVLAVSANAMPSDIERARAAGFVDYLTKPIDVNKVLQVVDTLLQRLENEHSSSTVPS